MNKIILDTNVPAKAAVAPELCPAEELKMQKACMEYIGELTKNKDKKLVLDLDHEIWKEYHTNVYGNSNMGKIFFKWLYEYYATILPEDNIKLHKDSEGKYQEFPYDDDTQEFDESDKKFVYYLMRIKKNHQLLKLQMANGLAMRKVLQNMVYIYNF